MHRLRRIFLRLIYTLRVGFPFVRKNYERAELMCREIVKKVPRDSLFHWWLSKILYRKGRLDEAIQELYVAIGLESKTYSMDRVDLITMLLQAKRYEDAIVECNKLIDKDFHNLNSFTRPMHQYVVYWGLAQAYHGLGDYRRAKEAAEKALPYYSRRAKPQLRRYIAQCEEYLREEK